MLASKPQTVTCDEGVPIAPYSDCLTLYEQIRAHKLRGILECGTSLSTVVLVQESHDNAAEDGGAPSRVISMEDDTDWYCPASARLAAESTGIIEIVHSPKTDGFYKCFCGVRYEEVSEWEYDFVFFDGSDRPSPVDSDKLFNLDLINVSRRSERPVRAVVDNYYLTFHALQKVFGLDKARYSASYKPMFVGP